MVTRHTEPAQVKKLPQKDTYILSEYEFTQCLREFLGIKTSGGYFEVRYTPGIALKVIHEHDEGPPEPLLVEPGVKPNGPIGEMAIDAP